MRRDKKQVPFGVSLKEYLNAKRKPNPSRPFGISLRAYQSYVKPESEIGRMRRIDAEREYEESMRFERELERERIRREVLGPDVKRIEIMHLDEEPETE